MFEVDYPSKQYRTYTFSWLKIDAIVCFLNAIVLCEITIRPEKFFKVLYL